MSIPLASSRQGHGPRTFQAASASDEAEYDRLRALAHAAHAKRNSCFERSRAAYASGQKALAKDLSNEGKDHDRVGDEHHRQARDYIFRVNNAQRGSEEIDLHGLYVQEAKDILATRIRAEQTRGGSGLHVIVGKGNHSEGGIQKIKPAVEELCRELNLQFSTEQNAGRMYISLAPVDGGQAGEVPAGNHPYKQSHSGQNTYGHHQQQPQHAYSGGSGAGYPGSQESSSHGYGSNAGPSGYQQYGHNQQQQQHHHQQQQQQTDFAGEVAQVAKKAFFKKLAQCCVVM